MHCILLNTVKNIWKVWDKGQASSNGGRPQTWFVDEQHKNIIYNVLRTSRNDIPLDLGTLPQNLDAFRQFKAAEWKTLVELYGTTLLYEHIPMNVWQNFRDLCRIWSIAIGYRTSWSDLVGITFCDTLGLVGINCTGQP